jgi:hypothetical protein
MQLTELALLDECRSANQSALGPGLQHCSRCKSYKEKKYFIKTRIRRAAAPVSLDNSETANVNTPDHVMEYSAQCICCREKRRKADGKVIEARNQVKDQAVLESLDLLSWEEFIALVDDGYYSNYYICLYF